MSLNWEDKVKFIIDAAVGDCDIIPSSRNYTLKFIGFTNCNDIEVRANGKVINFEKHYNELNNITEIEIKDHKVTEQLEVEFNGDIRLAKNNIVNRAFEFLNEAQIEFSLKEKIYKTITMHKNQLKIMGDLQAMDLDDDLFGVLSEIILAR